MNEMHELKAWLRLRKRDWAMISVRAGVSVKTISRLAEQPGYNTTVRTFESLNAERVRAAAHAPSSVADGVLA